MRRGPRISLYPSTHCFVPSSRSPLRKAGPREGAWVGRLPLTLALALLPWLRAEGDWRFPLAPRPPPTSPR